ncbi:hypothetical protein NMY22_g3690 [Coprinellus aureogranulatus]|nr:hypothetical protein NMY22_g3690 [Coprinellus aureogranulatus]
MADSILNDSPFRPWLNGNYTPADLDTVRLQEFLKEPVAQLAALNDEVEALERALEERLAQRILLSASIDRHKTLLHPIRRLPKEILQAIFMFCLPARHHPHLPAMDQRAAPLTLTRVCRDWRDLALNTPELWQRLHIVVQTGTRRFLEFHMAIVNRWLTAAKGQPLSISIWSKETPADDMLNIFADNILCHSLNIQSLTLDVTPPLVHLFAGSLPSSYWPMLERVCLKWRDDNVGTPNRIDLLPVWSAPLLKRVEWQSVDSDLWRTGIQWTNMEEILMYQREKAPPVSWPNLNPSRVRAMVQCTPKIRNLRITLSDQEFPTNLGPTGPLVLKTTLVLPHLTALNLTDVYINPDTAPIVFLEGLQLPALKVFKYGLCFAEGVENPHHDDHPLLRFLRVQRSPSLLHTFEVDVHAISRQGLLECLKLMPLLERLWIRDSRHDSRNEMSFFGPIALAQGAVTDKELLDSLLPSSPTVVPLDSDTSTSRAPDCLCPRLNNLRISRIKCDLEDVEAFVDARLAHSKASGVSIVPLKSLFMHVISTRQPEGCSAQEKRLEVEKALKARGVSAGFNYTAPDDAFGYRNPFGVEQSFDPFAGYENEKFEDKSELDWM